MILIILEWISLYNNLIIHMQKTDFVRHSLMYNNYEILAYITILYKPASLIL